MTKRLFGAFFVVLSLCTAGQAQQWRATLDGTQEEPDVNTQGRGTGTATFDPLTNMLAVTLNFQDLTGTTTDAHIHCCLTTNPTVGVALGFTSQGFPLTVRDGSFSATYDLLNPAVYTNAFRNNFGGGTAAGARDALIAGMNNGTAYFNIHSSFVGTGEIRGQITPVPEPSSMALMGIGAVLVGHRVLRRRA